MLKPACTVPPDVPFTTGIYTCSFAHSQGGRAATCTGGQTATITALDDKPPWPCRSNVHTWAAQPGRRANGVQAGCSLHTQAQLAWLHTRLPCLEHSRSCTAAAPENPEAAARLGSQSSAPTTRAFLRAMCWDKRACLGAWLAAFAHRLTQRPGVQVHMSTGVQERLAARG